MSDLSPFLADPALLQALERLSVSLRSDDDRILFTQGDDCNGLYILKSGEAVLEMRSDDGEVIFRFQTPGGSLLGLPSVLCNQPYSLTAIAFRGSQICFVNRTDAINLFSSKPELSLSALQVMAAETRSARLEMVSFMAKRVRVPKPESNGHWD
jgi:CRP-like cAMP-binding protein